MVTTEKWGVGVGDERKHTGLFQKKRTGFPRLREEVTKPQAGPPILGSTKLFWELDQRVPHG